MSSYADRLGRGVRGLRPAWWAPIHRRAAGAVRDPLAHFLLLGGTAFLLWPLLSDRLAAAPDRLVIGAAQLQRAAEIFAATHARPPSPPEMAVLAEQEIRDEVYYREGLALGLDRGDEIIRRRIEQKMRFMVQDVALAETPDDATLQRFLDANRARYASEPALAFSQLYLDPSRHGAAISVDAARLLARLRHQDGRLDYARDSDPLPLANDYEATPARVVAGMFGDEFAASLRGDAGEWSGPIRSGFGLHLVFLRRREAGPPPVLARIRGTVLRDWQAAQREEMNEQAYRIMRAKYRIELDLPGASAP